MEPARFDSVAEATRSTVPDWVCSLNRLVLAAEREEVQQRQARLWDDHFADLSADPSVSANSFVWSVIQSALSHVFWRLRFGPATGLGPAISSIVLGLAVLLLTIIGAAPLTVLAGATVAISFGTLILLEVARDAAPRYFMQRVVWALLSFGSAFTSLSYIFRPTLYAQDVAGVAILAAVLAAAWAALTPKDLAVHWGVWALLSLGSMGLVGANILSFLHYGLTPRSAAFFAIGTAALALGVSIGRLAQEMRYRQNVAATAAELPDSELAWSDS